MEPMGLAVSFSVDKVSLDGEIRRSQWIRRRGRIKSGRGLS